MNFDSTNKSAQRFPLTNEETSFLEQKKSHSVLFVTACVFVLFLSYIFYAFDIGDFVFALLYGATMTALFGFFIVREVGKISKINSDLRAGCKIVFEAEIEDFKQANQTNDSGEIIGSDYYLIVRGEKYSVKANDFFKFGRGDTVKIACASASKYAFDVAKIQHPKKIEQPDAVSHFTLSE